jgi:hypothetical protein
VNPLVPSEDLFEGVDLLRTLIQNINRVRRSELSA